MRFKVELESDERAPIPGKMRSIVETDVMWRALAIAREGAGQHYQNYGWAQPVSDAEDADPHFASRFMAFQDDA